MGGREKFGRFVRALLRSLTGLPASSSSKVGPVIAGVNDTEEEMRGIRAFLDSHGGCAEVELLPYHGMGEYKYSAIGRKCESFSPPDDERLRRLREIFLHK